MVGRTFMMALSVAFLALAGCETQTVSITRYTQANRFPPGKTFAMYALDSKKADSLEFKHYTKMVRATVQAATGWIPVSPDAPHDYKVAFDYIVGPPRTYYYYPDYGGISFGTGYWHHGPFISTSYGFGVPDYWETYYDYQLWLDIRAGGGPGRTDTKVFEARATTSDLASDVTYVMPCMLTALFRNFPGVNGESYSVTIPNEQCGPRSRPPIRPQPAP